MAKAMMAVGERRRRPRALLMALLSRLGLGLGVLLVLSAAAPCGHCGGAPPSISMRMAPTTRLSVGAISRGRAVVVVAPTTGDDSGSGSASAPFRTVARALAAARSGSGVREILMREGTHLITDPITLGPADSGLTIAAFGNESARVSGGVSLRSWQPHPALVGVYQHAAADLPFVRQLWVGGVRVDRTSLPRRPWNRSHPAVPGWRASPTQSDVYETDDLSALEWKNPQDVEFVFRPGYPARGGFTEHRCTLQSLQRSGTDGSLVQARVKQPCLDLIRMTYGRGETFHVGSALERQLQPTKNLDPNTLPTPAHDILSRNVSGLTRIENVHDDAGTHLVPGASYIILS